jgi:hypothetical protein
MPLWSFMAKSAEELFDAALELTNRADRTALLDRECAGIIASTTPMVG